MTQSLHQSEFFFLESTDTLSYRKICDIINKQMIDRRPIDSLYQNVYFEPGFVTDKRTRTIRSCEGDKRPPETMANGRSPKRKSGRSANGLTRSDSGRNRNRFDNYGAANVCRNRIMDSGNESEIDLMIFD